MVDGLVILMYGLATLCVVHATLDLSGIPRYEMADIRESFRDKEPFLVPLVVAGDSWWRKLLRVMTLLSVNMGSYVLARELGLDETELLAALVALILIEWVCLRVLVTWNTRRYRRDLEECQLLTHPSTGFLHGYIQDHSTPPQRGSNLISGGRLISVVSPLDSVEITLLVLLLDHYGQRKVTETDEPVVVFYQSWKDAGVAETNSIPEKSDYRQACGVYVGFRPDPNLAN